jgi:hypothetical protein
LASRRRRSLDRRCARGAALGKRPEKELITSFVDKIAALSPQLVTFNVKATFSIPIACGCATRLFRGRLSDAEFRASEANLADFVKARGNTKPHLACLM